MKAIKIKKSDYVKVTKLEFPSDSHFRLDAHFNQRLANEVFIATIEDEDRRKEISSSLHNFCFSGTIYLLQDSKGRYELLTEEMFKENYLVIEE